jgi:hypothetical protein
MVTAADPQTQKITIDDQSYLMPKEGRRSGTISAGGFRGDALLQGGRRQKMITRIGQKQQ